MFSSYSVCNVRYLVILCVVELCMLLYCILLLSIEKDGCRASTSFIFTFQFDTPTSFLLILRGILMRVSVVCIVPSLGGSLRVTLLGTVL